MQTDLGKELHFAAEKGEIETVRGILLIATREDVNSIDVAEVSIKGAIEQKIFYFYHLVL